jgi:hypothetical protein
MTDVTFASGRPPRARALAGTIVAALAAITLALLVNTRASTVAPAAPLAAAIFLILPAWLFVNRRVEQSLAVLMVYLALLDGVIKLMTNVEAATLGRDLMLYAIASGMLARAILQRRRLRAPPLTGWVVAWTAVVLVQLLNPANGSWSHSLSSLRQDLEFVPLFFIGFVVITSVGRLRAFLALLLVVAAVNGAVGLVQSGMSPEQLAGWGPGYAALIEGTGGAPRTSEGADGKKKVRPPGLGSDMGFAGVLGAIALPGGLALLLTRRRRAYLTWLCGPLMVLAAIAVITSQSRSAIITSIVAALAFLGLAVASRQASRVIMSLVAAGVLVLVAVTIVGKEDDDALFRYRSITPNRIVQTTIDSRAGTLTSIPEYLRSFPLGAGIGSVGPAAGTIGVSPKNKPSAESQFTYLIAELGIPGLIVFLAFYAHLLAVVVARLRRVRDREAQLLLAALAAPLFAFAANWIVGVNTVSTPNSPYLWFVTGVLSLWLLARAPRRVGHAPPAAS